ncbi:MAG: ABC transporter permease [Candidatus Woesearchaeota archaeon]
MLDLFIMAFRNVRRRKKRTFLTMLGVFIGIAAVVALVSLGQGLQAMIDAQFEKIGADKIIIQAKEIGYGGQRRCKRSRNAFQGRPGKIQQRPAHPVHNGTS